ncbi:MAG: UvrD-helicase domain-containing protein, partial [Stackebrandtia sp.]
MTRYSAVELARRLGDDHAPTAQQAAAIEAPLSPLLIVAGAGSGKTAVMAARVVWLIANGHVRPEQVLGLTFTRKAAGELGRRIRQRLRRLHGISDDPALLRGEPTVSTYHSYAASVVAEHGPRAGYEPAPAVLSTARAWQLGYAAVRGYDGDMSATSLTMDTVVERVLSLSDEMAEHLRDAREVRDFTEATIDEIAERVASGTKETKKLVDNLRSRVQLLPIVEDYRRRKHAQGAVDFADQLAQAARLAREAPEVGRVERGRFPVVLLDEYQDT